MAFFDHFHFIARAPDTEHRAYEPGCILQSSISAGIDLKEYRAKRAGYAEALAMVRFHGLRRAAPAVAPRPPPAALSPALLLALSAALGATLMAALVLAPAWLGGGGGGAVGAAGHGQTLPSSSSSSSSLFSLSLAFASPSPLASASASASASRSSTRSAARSASATPSPSPSPTVTTSATNSASPTPSPTPARSPPQSISATPTPTPAPPPSPTLTRAAPAAPPERVAFGGAHALSPADFRALQAETHCLARGGRWEETNESVGLLYSSWVPFGEGDCGLAPPYTKELRPGFFYQWAGHAPGSCAMPARRRFSRADFCRALGGRHLLIVGDSLSHTFEVALLHALLDEPEHQPHDQWTACPVHAVCRREAAAPGGEGILEGSVQYVRNDYLTLEAVDRNQQEWKSFVTGRTIAVLNRGAHFVADEAFAAGLGATLDWFLNNAPRGAGLVWRSTVVGHELPDWLYSGATERFRRPLQQPPERSGMYASYNWGQFDRQNELVERALADRMAAGAGAGGATGAHGMLFLDAAFATKLRTDRHQDPLHYCTPGPTDFWVVLLQAALEAAARLEAAAAARGGGDAASAASAAP